MRKEEATGSCSSMIDPLDHSQKLAKGLGEMAAVHRSKIFRRLLIEFLKKGATIFESSPIDHPSRKMTYHRHIDDWDGHLRPAVGG